MADSAIWNMDLVGVSSVLLHRYYNYSYNVFPSKLCPLHLHKKTLTCRSFRLIAISHMSLHLPELLKEKKHFWTFFPKSGKRRRLRKRQIFGARMGGVCPISFHANLRCFVRLDYKGKKFPGINFGSSSLKEELKPLSEQIIAINGPIHGWVYTRTILPNS